MGLGRGGFGDVVLGGRAQVFSGPTAFFGRGFGHVEGRHRLDRGRGAARAGHGRLSAMAGCRVRLRMRKRQKGRNGPV